MKTYSWHYRLLPGLSLLKNTLLKNSILLLESPCPLVGWLVRWFVGSFVGNKKTPHHRYTHQGHRSQIYASFIPASYTHASGSRIIYIKLLWIHASCIHASYIHASGSRIINMYTSHIHTYIRVKAQPNRYMHHTFMHQSYIYVHHIYVHHIYVHHGYVHHISDKYHVCGIT